ncbi:gamma-glutamyltransferase [Sedimenticola thiotaurini]|uniref:gamma-glutamyltransferase n=1 Tax=Sedimenticola thiotaurini TaxID=1543721 RepID=UPI000699464F|nr:gamma-glutamyltransferase [Sedimenticola thiotaurini]
MDIYHSLRPRMTTRHVGWRKPLLFCACLLLTVGTTPGWGGATQSPGVPGVQGGVVATSEPNAARIGAEILRRGGNAIDAAAAVQFALNVVEPESSGIGGGGFMLIYLADEKKSVAIDSRETAPAAATADMFVPFIDNGGFSVASTSGLSVGVPGTLKGVELALQKWGTMSLAETLQPAIALARDGFRVGRQLAESSTSSRLQNEPGNPAYDEARKVFRPGDAPLQRGQLLVQPDLARTLQLIADRGSEVFYTGEIARAIVATQQTSRAQRPEGRGLMTLEDLANYQAVIREPLSGEYRGYTITSMGPPSSGALTLLQILKLLERFPIGDSEAGFGFGSTRTLNVMIEAMRLAFADRALWMGDADFVQVPVKGLLDDDYIARRSALIDPDRRQPRVVPDDPRPFEAQQRGEKQKLAALTPTLEKGVNTTHFSIVDRHGNMVSYTTTVESAWGTGLMVPGYGFLLNNELTDFNFVPGFNPDPNHYNPGANDVAPNKRPRSSMSPSLLFRDGQPLAAYGSPGGSTIIDSVVNISINLIDHGMDIQQAVDAPRIVQTSANGSVGREIGFSEQVMQALEKLGHTLREPVDIGSVQAVVMDPADGTQYGAADRRRVGSVISLGKDERKTGN